MADPTRKRLQAMHRVASVREEMRRREELKLAKLAQEAAALRNAQQELDAFLARQEHAGGRLFEHLAKTHRSLYARSAEIAKQQAAQSERVLVQARHEKLAERRVDELTQSVRRNDEKRELAEWVERAAIRRTSVP